MNTYTYCNNAGRVMGLYSGSVPDLMDDLNPEYQRVDGAVDGATHYILDGAPTLRPISPVAIDGLILSAVPPGSTLYIDGSAYPIEGDTAELEFPLPGSYSVRVECFPFLDYVGTVTV